MISSRTVRRCISPSPRKTTSLSAALCSTNSDGSSDSAVCNASEVFFQVEVVFVMRVVQYRVVVHLVDTRYGADVAGKGDFDLGVVATVELQ